MTKKEAWDFLASLSYRGIHSEDERTQWHEAMKIIEASAKVCCTETEKK